METQKIPNGKTVPSKRNIAGDQTIHVIQIILQRHSHKINMAQDKNRLRDQWNRIDDSYMSL